MKIIDRKFLPTNTRAVHAATIEFHNDHPVFAWFGGSREGQEDVAIYLHNLNGEEKTLTVGTRDRYPRWNPILYKHDETLFMFEKIGIFCDRWQTYIHDVTDWDENTPEKEKRALAQVLPAGLNGPVKTKPLRYFSLAENCDDDGWVICGSSVETFSDWTSYIETYEIKDGKWDYVARSAPIAVKEKVMYHSAYNGVTKESQGVIQPALWIDDNHRINAFMRSSGGLENIYRYRRTQDGHKDPEPTNFMNPNSGVDVVNMDGRLFLVSNPDEVYRVPLTVTEIKETSLNQFEIVDEIVIRSEIDPNDTCNSQELSYPYMIEHNGKLHLTYTYGRSKIEYVVIDV